jgi:hypothetical protein
MKIYWVLLVCILFGGCTTKKNNDTLQTDGQQTKDENQYFKINQYFTVERDDKIHYYLEPFYVEDSIDEYISSNSLSGENIIPARELVNLPNLEILVIRGWGLKDYVFLEHITFIKYLEIDIPGFDINLEPFEKLINLEHLVLYCYGVNDLSPIINLKNLKHLKIYNSSGIIDINPIGKLTNLETLHLYEGGGNLNFDSNIFSNFSKLELLSMSMENEIDHVFNVNLPKLKKLSIGSNHIIKNIFLLNAPELQILSIWPYDIRYMDIWIYGTNLTLIGCYT